MAFSKHLRRKRWRGFLVIFCIAGLAIAAYMGVCLTGLAW